MGINKSLSGVQKNIPLKNHTAFKIGGRAKYFFAAKTKEEIIRAIKWAKENNLPFFILGGGSNLLVSDRGFNGLVIKFGQPLFDYVSKAELPKKAKVKNRTKSSSPGLEWTAGIPGTLQAAVYGNAGAFGKSMKDAVESVEVFDVKTEKIKIFKNKDCQFGYRDSVFKRKKNLVILSAKIKSRKSNAKKIKEYLSYKKKTQPLNYPSAGSIFKNPKNFYAGELIDKCGLKGKKIGRAQISEKHSNFIVNLGGASAKDVKKLINLAKKRVKNKFKINLEEEIELLGFKN